MTGQEWNGYANRESFMFEVHTANTWSLYREIRDYAADCLRRVPGMTAQTLGANIKLTVRGWVLDAQNGEPAQNYGWGKDGPLDIPRRELLELAEAVGDFSRVNEDELGQGWLDMFAEETGE